VTEQEWDGCTDPGKMLEFLRGKGSERKLRLFICACCRRFWHLLVDSRSQQAVEISERFADALAGQAELASAGEEARSAGDAVARQIDPGVGFDAARAVLLACALPVSPLAAEQLAGDGVALACAGPGLSAAKGERQAQPDLLRDVFGKPFRPLHVDPAWLAWHGGAAVKLAQAIYEERSLPEGTLDRARLAVLADVLEKAGCSDAVLLSHLRGPGPHVRGCFAVDALLGRAWPRRRRMA
jgi:hypothetical protein